MSDSDEVLSDAEYAYSSGEDAMDEEYAYTDSEGEGIEEMVSNGTTDAKSKVQVLDPAELVPMMRKQIEEVGAVIELPSVSVAALLRKHGWSKERLFEKYYQDPESITKEAGVDLWEDDPSSLDQVTGASMVKLPKVTGKEVCCPVCYDDLPAEETIAAPCGHFYCKDCYSDYLSIKIKDGPSCIETTCPKQGCNTTVPPQMFSSLQKELTEKYNRFIVNSFVDMNKSMRWCPAPNCSKIVSAPLGTQDVRCFGKPQCCNYKFCFKCGEEAHQPVGCEELVRWQSKCQNDSETANWILANTKRCPKCNTRIEKNQGCNHMTCRQCKYEFCWICMGAWSDHGANTGGYYKCNKYDPNASAGDDDNSKASNAKKELDRYLHYYQRFHNHGQAMKFAEQQRENTEKRMIELQEQSESMSWIDVQFLKEALEMLIDCRRVLKYTYVFGFYLNDATAKKELFEHHQEQLEKFTEQLSELTEVDLTKIERAPVINTTRVTGKFQEQLVQSIEEGLEGDVPVVISE